MKRMKMALAVVVLLCVAVTCAFAQGEVLGSISALGAAYMYTTYISIGTVADSHSKEVYTDDTAIQLMEEIKTLVKRTIISLQALLDADLLSGDDANNIEKMTNTLGFLYKEAESYQKFVQTGEERQAALYDAYRNNAWSNMAELLGIEE